MGHAVGSEFKAQMDLGTLVPYSYRWLCIVAEEVKGREREIIF